jgi:CubicO group peptidase (beta-lactamase class C family)
MLGVIVERVSGKTYYNYVNENIYKPAGMTSTSSLPEDQNVRDRSVGYTRDWIRFPIAAPQPAAAIRRSKTSCASRTP